MNALQQFIDNPTPETLGAIKNSPLDAFYDKYCYPAESTNFWHFIFHSPAHLDLLINTLDIRDDLDALGRITFNTDYKSTFDSIDNFDPFDFSLNQNLFLYASNQNYIKELKANKTRNFMTLKFLTDNTEECRDFIVSKLNANDKNIIQQYYDRNKDTVDSADYVSLLAAQMMYLYDNLPDIRSALFLTTNYLMLGIGRFNKVRFLNMVANYPSYHQDNLLEDVISVLNPIYNNWSTSIETSELPYNKKILLIDVALLFFQNVSDYKMLKNHSEHSAPLEKLHLDKVIVEQKTNKILKL